MTKEKTPLTKLIKPCALSFMLGVALIVSLNSFSKVFMFHTSGTGITAAVYPNTIEAMKVALGATK